MGGEVEGRAKGGRARAAKLTADERSAAARKASTARWGDKEHRVAVSGSSDRPLVIGNAEIECYVLEDGTRVITQGTMLEALGRSRRVNRKVGDDMELPPILRARSIREFINDDLISEAQIVRFKTTAGKWANGYKADILPDVCEAWIQADEAGQLHERQKPIAAEAHLLIRGLARVGIIALVDEATGYQDIRTRDALAKILEAYVAKELQPWVKTFDPDFYKEMFRLRQRPYDPTSVKRPPYFGTLTNNVVYKRVAPGVLDEIKAQRAKDETKKSAKFHQQLTPSLGQPKLREHIASVTTVMKLSDTWEDFIEKLDRVHPIYPSARTDGQEVLWDGDFPNEGI